MIALGASFFLFLALAAGSIAIFHPAGSRRGPLAERIRALRPAGGVARRSGTPAPGLRPSPSSVPWLRRLLSDSARGESIALELRQADVGLRVGEFLLLRWLLAALLFLVPALLSRLHPVGLLVGLAGVLLGYLLPGFYLKSARRGRLAKVERQLVEFLPLLASSLRSGFALPQGIEAAARQLGPPLGDELALLLSDVNLGATTQAALEDLQRRVGSPGLDIVVTAILVQRTTGGNLAEVLDRAAETLLERERIRGELHTLTTQQRLTGLVLMVYPIVVGLVLLALMPGIWSRLFTEPAGQIQLAIAGSLQLLGFFAIRRALRVEY
ncbi:MAG: hypothetical protein A2148_02800 [Chloroflexi bacterium RBG_16_68_14]|nr:MAG: hypothetical protein A2148_02800 [Chloroflexi bacterium RBG_16_68_14]